MFGGLIGAATQSAGPTPQQQVLASQQAALAQQQPVAAAAPQPAATAQAVPAAPGLAAQASARKEHLTGLFQSKGCKLADVQH